MSTMNSHILNEAIRATAERSSTHGGPEEQFDHTAGLWSAYLGFTVSPADVCQCLALLKMSRSKIGKSSVSDHYIDQTGYGALAGRMALNNYPNLLDLERAIKEADTTHLFKGTENGQ
jgi:hypothetical protein